MSTCSKRRSRRQGKDKGETGERQGEIRRALRPVSASAVVTMGCQRATPTGHCASKPVLECAHVLRRPLPSKLAVAPQAGPLTGLMGECDWMAA